MSAVTDFKAIKLKLDRMEQKAEFEKNNPTPAQQYAAFDWSNFVGGVFVAPETDPA